jgi:hypothetical protein
VVKCFIVQCNIAIVGTKPVLCYTAVPVVLWPTIKGNQNPCSLEGKVKVVPRFQFFENEGYKFAVTQIRQCLFGYGLACYSPPPPPQKKKKKPGLNKRKLAGSYHRSYSIIYIVLLRSAAMAHTAVRISIKLYGTQIQHLASCIILHFLLTLTSSTSVA